MANKGSFKPGDQRAGRPKGTQNKLTVKAKDAFAHAFEDIGGTEALGEWAQANRDEFYKLYARLIPVESDVSAAIRFIVDSGMPPTKLDE